MQIRHAHVRTKAIGMMWIGICAEIIRGRSMGSQIVGVERERNYAHNKIGWCHGGSIPLHFGARLRAQHTWRGRRRAGRARTKSADISDVQHSREHDRSVIEI